MVWTRGKEDHQGQEGGGKKPQQHSRRILKQGAAQSTERHFSSPCDRKNEVQMPGEAHSARISDSDSLAGSPHGRSPTAEWLGSDTGDGGGRDAPAPRAEGSSGPSISPCFICRDGGRPA